MPASCVRTFTDPEAYFKGIRNLSIDGFVTGRGKFRADALLIDLHRLQMGRFDEDLPRIMRITPSGTRSLILFATDSTRSAMLSNGIEASHHQIAMFGLHWPYYLRSSAASRWGTMSLTPEDLAAAGRAIIGRELTPPSFMLPIRPRTIAIAALAAARSNSPPRKNCPGYPCQARSSTGNRGGFGGSDGVIPGG